MPFELLFQAKSVDFVMCFNVTRREIDVVDMIHSQTGENLGPASFETGTELQIMRRSGSPTVRSMSGALDLAAKVKPLQASAAAANYNSVATAKSGAMAVQKTKPATRVSAASQGSR